MKTIGFYKLTLLDCFGAALMIISCECKSVFSKCCFLSFVQSMAQYLAALWLSHDPTVPSSHIPQLDDSSRVTRLGEGGVTFTHDEMAINHCLQCDNGRYGDVYRMVCGLLRSRATRLISTIAANVYNSQSEVCALHTQLCNCTS